MRVLAYFGGRLLESRGTPSRARNLIRALGALPQIDLIALSGDTSPEASRALGIEHFPIPSIEQRSLSLRQAIDSFRPDVVYGHTHKAMNEMRSLGNGAPARVVDLHGHTAFEKLEAPGKSLPLRFLGFANAQLAEARGLRAMDAFTVCSDPLARHVSRVGKPVLVVWGGVDPSFFRPHGAEASGPLRVVYAGNFRPYQGVDVILNAGRRLLAAGEEFELSLVGDIDRFPDFKGKVLEQLAGHVEIHGQIDYRRMPEALSSANVLVIPRPAHRTTKFGFPSKLAEYLAMERTTVATRVGDLTHAITDMETGLLIAPGSVDELHGALLRLKDHDLRNRLAKAGRRYAEEHLAWPVLARQVERFLGEVLDARG